MKTFSHLERIGLLLLLFTRWESYGQPTLHFEHLTELDGLSENKVRTIHQDREGFMWFGTDGGGLNKYDGYTFTVFKADPNDPQRTLRHNGITNIYEDPQGRLWIVTFIGLHLLDKRTGKVTAFLVDSTRNKNVNMYLNMHFSVFRDHQGLYWLSSGGGINRFDPTTKKFFSYPFSQISTMYGIAKDSTGRFWVGSSVGLNRFEPRTGKFIPFSLATTPLHPPINALHLDAAGILWIGTQGEGLFRMDTKRSLPQASRYDAKGLVNKSINMNGIYEDASGTLWLATTEGLQRIDKQTNQVITYRSNAALPGTLSSNNVQAVYKDRTGNLWVATDNGINKVTAHPKPFYTHQINPTSPLVRLYENNIHSVLEDHTGTIWLGTAKGLYQLDSNFKPIAHLHVNPVGPDHLSGGWVRAIYEDSKSRIWVGTREALQLWDRHTGKFTPYPFASAVNLNFNNHIAEDASGKLWRVGGGGIACFDPNKNQYTYYLPNPKDPTRLKDRYINASWLAGRVRFG